jgi:ribosomal-protein-alanine N-acetyltransferase
MASPCLVRSATRADVPAIVALERTIFSDPWSSGGFFELLGESSLVAVADDQVVGYLFARLLAPDEAEILNLAVQKDRRGRGMGRSLIEAALHGFRKKRVRTVFLEVRASNAQGQRFYHNVGFREVGRRRGYYDKPCEDALILALEFAPTKGSA